MANRAGAGGVLNHFWERGYRIRLRDSGLGEIQGQGRKHSPAHAGSACSKASVFMSLRAPQALKGRLHNFAYAKDLVAYPDYAAAKLNSQSLNFGLVIHAPITPVLGKRHSELFSAFEAAAEVRGL